MTLLPHQFEYCYHPTKSGGTCRYQPERWWITPIGNVFGRCWNHMLTRGESRDLKELTKKEVAVYRVMDS